MIKNYEFHEVANLFPMMSEEEFTSLKEDIKANGQIEPITIYQDQIIDGRNRYKACEYLDLEPKVREWDGRGSLVKFVYSLNMNRRHLSNSQKATIAVEMLPLLEEERRKEKEDFSSSRERGEDGTFKPVTQKIGELDKSKHDGESTAQAAKIVGTNRQYVSDAKKIKQDAPEIFEKMKSGEMNINIAKQYASLPKETRGKLLENKTKQVEGKNKACTACGELLPLKKFTGTSSQCNPCQWKKEKAKKKELQIERDKVDEKQEWLDSQVKTFDSHLMQVVMFLERNENLEEIINQGFKNGKENYFEAVEALDKISNALKNKFNNGRVI